MASNNLPRRTPSPRNPLLSSAPFSHTCGFADALSNSADVLATLADLFGERSTPTGFTTLNTEAARRGVFLLLSGVMEVLEAAACVELDQEAFEDVTIALGQSQLEQLQALALQRNGSIEAMAEQLLNEQLAFRAQEVAL